MFLNELRYAVRVLLKRPAYLVASVLTLALAIGANTAIFSVVHAVLLRRLPYKDSAKLVMIWQADPKRNIDHFADSIPYFKGWRDQNRVFEEMAAIAGQDMDLTGSQGPERVLGTLVSANFFSVLGAKPALGRTFIPEEDEPNHANVAVLSYELWQHRFGGNQQVVGQVITTDKTGYTIVGVMPRDFQFLDPSALWVPLGKNAESLHIPGNFPLRILAAVTPLRVVARLKPHVSLEQAQDNLNVLTTAMQSAMASPWQARVVTLNDELVGTQTRRILVVLLAAVGLVLLIACANIANLQLVHVTNRQREMATRLALGAMRRRLVYQLFVESGVIAIAGGIFGLLLAAGAVSALGAFIPAKVLGMQRVSVDGPMLLFSLFVSLLSIPLFATIPALRISRPDLASTLKESALSASHGARQRRLQSAFVISEVALASVLLIGAMLTIKSLYRLSEINLGLDPHNVLTMEINLSKTRYPVSEKQIAFFDEVRSRVQALPGVRKAGMINFLPLTGFTWQWSISVDGDTSGADHTYPVNYRTIAGDYFQAMQVPLLQGRFFESSDSASTSSVVIINEAMAKQFWPNQDPLGKRIKMGDRTAVAPWLLVVGVVANVKEVDLTDQPKPVFYVPLRQTPQSAMVLVLRTSEDTDIIVPAVRERILSLDANQPVHDIRTMDSVLASSVADSRFNALLLSIFAGIATFLAIVGIYSVIAYFVAQRSHEIGIRLALGAGRQQIILMMLGQALKVIGIGIAVGLFMALGLTRFLASLLYNVKPLDPVIFISVVALLGFVAVIAGFLPLRRTTKIDPVVSLRYE